jgi:oligopeptide/dipeptide ABC transporter ATP-binding protein
MTAVPLVRVEHLVKHFKVGGGWFGRGKGKVHAVDDVSFDIRVGETLGLVGESGCGKSTLARCVARLVEPDSGAILFDGDNITHRSMRALRPIRRRMQLIFQDPYASLNPRHRIGRILDGALRLRQARVSGETGTAELLTRVGLAPHFAGSLPRELSGGQRQRVGIARALAPEPQLIVADEPVSALDVSVRAGVLNLLRRLQRELKLTMLFISHDLGVIRHVSDRIGVMYLGKLVELATADEFYRQPLHPYSEALLSAIPVPDPDARAGRRRIVLKGDVPSPISPPAGCRFHPRCPSADAICASEEPGLEEHLPGRFAACHFPRLQGVAAAPP